MSAVRIEDLIFGLLLALVALVCIVIAVRSVRSRDREALSMSAGLGTMCAIFSLVLCTGWVNILPLPVPR